MRSAGLGKSPSPPRPNVVWTHTLLIPRNLLNVKDLHGLLSRFRRPRVEDLGSWFPYREPLEFPAFTEPLDRMRLDPALVGYVLDGLYRAGVGTVVCAIEGLESRDALCMAIWNQQWPRMRGQFSFCSGALEPRRSATGPFDLLLTPPTNTFPSVAPPGPPLPPYVMEALIQDLLEPGPLRQFLRKCGPDSARRRVLPVIAEAYAGAVEMQPIERILSRVTEQAPKAGSLRRLKRSLLDPKGGLLRHSSPVEVMNALLATNVAEHILISDSHLREWAARSWTSDPAAVLGAYERCGAEKF